MNRIAADRLEAQASSNYTCVQTCAVCTINAYMCENHARCVARCFDSIVQSASKLTIFVMSVKHCFSGPRRSVSTRWFACSSHARSHNFVIMSAKLAFFMQVPDEVSVQDGSLVLRTRHRKPGVLGPGGVVFNYTSGWVDTSSKVRRVTVLRCMVVV